MQFCNSPSHHEGVQTSRVISTIPLRPLLKCFSNPPWSVICNPLTLVDANRSKRIQRKCLKFAGFVLKISQAELDYNTSVANRLNLFLLSERRWKANLKFLVLCYVIRVILLFVNHYFILKFLSVLPVKTLFFNAYMLYWTNQ